MRRIVTVRLAESQAEHLILLCSLAARLPLAVTGRRVNNDAYGQLVQAYADARGRSRRSVPAPAPTPLHRGPLYWDAAAGLFVREGTGGPGATG